MEHSISFPGLGWNFTVNTTAFSIGSFSVQWYGIIIACGFLLAVIYGMRMAGKMNIKADSLYDCIIVGLILGVIGARLYYVIFYPGSTYRDNPLEIFNIKEGGLGIYGGIIGGLLGGGIMAKIRRVKVGAALDVACIGYCIGQCIGRWGNFINQEAFGCETSLPWGMQSDATLVYASGTVHPCFFYESLWMLEGFILLHLFNRYLRHYDGQTFLMYLIWYGTGRFFIEALRTDSLMIPVLNLKVSQVVAIATVLAGIVLLVIFRNKTSLTGCGSSKIMELNGVVMNSVKSADKAEEKTEEKKKSTIFADEENKENKSDKSDEGVSSEPMSLDDMDALIDRLEENGK